MLVPKLFQLIQRRDPEFVISAGIAEIQDAWIARSLPSMALDARIPASMTDFLVFN
jgi:hypothetical protein